MICWCLLTLKLGIIMNIYVLDTSVILHNWIILRDERKKVIPFQCLEDIEKFQTEPGELGDNARNACNFISKQIENGFQENTILENGGEILQFFGWLKKSIKNMMFK